MYIAIVGTSHLYDEEKERAWVKIEDIVNKARRNNDSIITGDADGIDKIVKTVCNLSDVDFRMYESKIKQWGGVGGFKERNTAIAERADLIYSISTAIKQEPCYHCELGTHERTGGCYTMRLGQKLGKKGELIVV